MLSKIALRLTKFVLHRADLSLDDRNVLTVHILKKLDAFPLRDMIISNEQGKLLVNGQVLSVEGARALRESARGALQNKARKFVHDQVLFTAINMGVHELERVEQSYFARAAIWWSQQEDLLLATLAQQDPDRELGPDDTEI